MNMQRFFRLITALLLITMPAAAAAASAADSFSSDFLDRTMRVDYFHTGGRGTEIVALDRVLSDGAWAGSTTHLIDDSGLGKYFYRVLDQETGRLLFSRGFASIYGEWETTSEARAQHRTFHESLRFPWPKRPVRVVLEKRDGAGWTEIWRTDVDPASRFVNPTEPSRPGTVRRLIENGHPHEKVDLLIIGDGYTERELPKLRSDAQRLVSALFDTEPFLSRRGDFNVWLLELPVERSGVDQPRTRDDRRNPLGTAYNIFDSERYILTMDNRAFRDIAAAAPYDFVEILVNEAQYGGGGIYNNQATVSVDTGFAEYVFIHEFGHHFAALGDEYYTSAVAYEPGGEVKPEPWEPNITALHDPANLKWKDLVTPGTPLPTPWPKAEYEAYSRKIQERRSVIRESNRPETEMDALFNEEKEYLSRFLASATYAGRVGAFEGASYEETGLYRPEIDCIMFTRNDVGFCAVCTRAINRVIDMYSRPVSDHSH